MMRIVEHDDLIQYKGLEGTIKLYYVLYIYMLAIIITMKMLKWQ